MEILDEILDLFHMPRHGRLRFQPTAGIATDACNLKHREIWPGVPGVFGGQFTSSAGQVSKPMRRAAPAGSSVRVQYGASSVIHEPGMRRAQCLR